MANSVLKVQPTVEGPQTDLEQRGRLAASLTAMLADAYVLMVKTQGFHWNVVGPLFVSLHELTEQQYQDLFGAIDKIAERIRALGYPAPTSIADLMPHSALAEAHGSNFSAEQMVSALISTTRPFRAGCVTRSRWQKIFAMPRRRTCSPSGCRSTRRPTGCYGQP